MFILKLIYATMLILNSQTKWKVAFQGFVLCKEAQFVLEWGNQSFKVLNTDSELFPLLQFAQIWDSFFWQQHVHSERILKGFNLPGLSLSCNLLQKTNKPKWGCMSKNMIFTTITVLTRKHRFLQSLKSHLKDCKIYPLASLLNNISI